MRAKYKIKLSSTKAFSHVSTLPKELQFLFAQQRVQGEIKISMESSTTNSSGMRICMSGGRSVLERQSSSVSKCSNVEKFEFDRSPELESPSQLPTLGQILKEETQKPCIEMRAKAS